MLFLLYPSITTRFVKKKKEKLLNFDLIGSDRLFLRFLHFPFPRRSKGKSEFLLRVSFLPVSRESLAGETNPSCQRKGTRVNRDEDQMSTARLNYSNYPRTKGWRKGEERKGREESKLDDGRDGDRPVVRDNKLSLPRRYHVFSFRPGASLPPGPFLFVLLRAKPCRSFRRHAFNDVDGAWPPPPLPSLLGKGEKLEEGREDFLLLAEDSCQRGVVLWPWTSRVESGDGGDG